MTQLRRRNFKAVLLSLAALGASSLLAVFAVPLYQLFCQVTGYGGTTQRVDTQAGPVLDRKIEVRFDASVDPALPWSFAPVQRTQEVQVGESALAFYRAENLSARAITGSAVFNVTPYKAGRYFTKIDCFCFTEQTLAPGEATDMAVTYFVDPAIADDPTLDEVREITLSYTFYFRNEAGSTVAALPAADTVRP